MDEEREDLERQMKDGSAVNTMINGKGWQKVVRPMLEARIDALVSEFLSASGLEEFIRIQQAIKAIQSLLETIEVTVYSGKEAITELRANP